MNIERTQSHTPGQYMLGAFPTERGTLFRSWSTRAPSVAVVLYGEDGGEVSRTLDMQAREGGVYEVLAEGVGVGARYKFALGGEVYPDPFARWLPEGVHGPAVVWAPTFEFRHETPKLKRDELVIYELHIGTFTAEGTYVAAQARLEDLRDLGVNCVELLPVSAFPGERGWGYDGVMHFAPYRHYGTPEELMAFVDHAHGLGMVVLLDMVYNHFGPDGNYLGAFSPEYFTHAHRTPWGDALDYTNPFMRHLVLDSAEHWLRVYRFDGFRLDATQNILDDSPRHVLDELAERVHRLGGGHFLFCEDYRNDPGLVTDMHMDGVWVDDFHHQVRVCLTGEQDGHFVAYRPDLADLARCIERGWLYEGQAVWPMKNDVHGEHWKRGSPADALGADNMVFFIQNHDQIGNRGLGDRLPDTAGHDGFLAASVLLMFLPQIPLIFQGQEWAASSPFQFFSDHHGELGQMVSQGRLEEFGHFEAFQDPKMRDLLPDPQAPETFERSKLNWEERGVGEHARTLDLYRTLLRLRREDAVLSRRRRDTLAAGCVGSVLWVRRWHEGEQRVLLVNFGHEAVGAPDVDGVAVADMTALLDTSGSGGTDALAPRSARLLAGRRP